LIPAAVGLQRMQEELQYGRKGEAEVVIGGLGWQSSSAGRITDRPNPSQQSWPLLKRATISRANSSIELIRKLEAEYDLYLNDHRLDGRPVFPVAMATELMAEVAAQGWPDLQVAQVRDLFVLHGIVLQDGAKAVRVIGKAQPIAAQGRLSIAVEIAATENPQRIHYRAIVDLVERLPDPPSFEPLSPATEHVLSIDLSEIYREWLFHGPLFQGVREINYIGTDGVVAVLASSSPLGWVAEASDAPWLIDPLMFDSGLQLLILWSREHWGMTTLPSRFLAYRRFNAELTKRIHCEVRIRPNPGSQTIHADMVFVNTDGRVVGTLEDAEGTCTRALNRLMQRNAAALFNR
jgi:hypothetical protein